MSHFEREAFVIAHITGVGETEKGHGGGENLGLGG